MNVMSRFRNLIYELLRSSQRGSLKTAPEEVKHPPTLQRLKMMNFHFLKLRKETREKLNKIREKLLSLHQDYASICVTAIACYAMLLMN